MGDEIKKELQEMGISEEDLQDPAKVEELAKGIEEENKKKAGEEATPEVADKKDEILTDKLQWLAKAIAKRQTLKAKPEAKIETEQPVLSEADIANKIYAGTKNLSEAKVKALEELAHLPSNKGKSFEEISKTTLGDKALSDIEASENAVVEIDANASDDELFQFKRDIPEKYDKTLDEPTSDYEMAIAAGEGLEKIGLKEY